MEEQQPPTLTETTPTATTSLAARLTNIFVSPSEVFTEIKNSPPRHANWIVPLVIAMIVGVIFSIVVFSQPRVIQGMQDVQEKKFQQLVEQGKMTQAQADEATAAVGKFMSPTFLKLVGSAGATVANAAILFFAALILWLIGKYAFHGSFTYMQGVEAVGLSLMITVLGAIIAMFLAVIYGNLQMTPGPVLLVKQFDPGNKVHLVLSGLSVPSLWWVAVLSIGLARLSGGSVIKSAIWLYSIWALMTLGPGLVFGGK